MTKKQKIVLIIFCALLALLLIGTLIGTAALLLSGNTHGLADEWLTGYVNELRENQELVQIEKEWESVIQNENSDIAQIVIKSGEVQSVATSSTLNPWHSMTLDEKEQIDAVIEILSKPDVIWEHPPKDLQESISFDRSRYGMQAAELLLLDSDGQVFLRITVYEDNACFILSQPEIISESHVRWHGSYRMILSEEVFQPLYDLQKSFE